MRREFEMTQQQLDTLLEACAPVPAIMLQCIPPQGQQERANAAWQALGEELGFDHMTVQPVAGKSQRFFTAVEVASVNA